MGLKAKPKAGDRVRYIGPSFFESGKNWTGTVVREPLTPKTMKHRVDDFRYLVKVGVKKDGRPKLAAVREEHLEVM